ncbi:selenocysteine-specific translation elongation factor [Deltaproteobacteria bacterium]|nr:selenocysteine-specific translation elongation factor [Deltaproteobacteria bacterium]
MKQVILGTAGHIDHGKTSLIKALTNIDTDRLKEEKERGITIELGFAHLELPSGQLLGIIDVPGHEKFVKNMVSGATGIDLVSLIIAADEGVMPQTREHMEICNLLGIKSGLVVLTKIDMVDDEWLELVREDVTAYLSGTFLEDSPVIGVSSTTGDGVEELAKAIDDLVKEIPEREIGNFFRLPIDRVFTMKGFGTVVTGTTISGSINTGEDVTVYPQELSSRIRGIQVHNDDTNQVSAGLRTAINLQGAEKANIQRGNVLAAKDSLRSTYMVDVELELLPSSPRKLKNRAKVRFHSGTSEIISTVVLLDRDELEQGNSCYAQIRLDEPTAVLLGDRFILRSYSPVRAIGGGKVLNALPLKKKRFSKAVLKELELLNSGTLQEKAREFVRIGRFQGRNSDELQFLTNSGKKKLDEALKVLQAQKKIIQYNRESGTFIHSEYLEKATEEIISTLTEYHNDFPLKAGLLKEELRSRTTGSRNQKLFNFIISQLTRESIVVQEKELLRLQDHKVTLALDQEKIRGQIEEAYLNGGLQPPYFKELNSRFPENTAWDVLEVMVKDGILIKVKEDLYFHRDVMDELEKRLIVFLKDHGEINTPQFKEMTGASRKYTIPLIEYFDRSQVTVRVGDNRVLRKK